MSYGTAPYANATFGAGTYPLNRSIQIGRASETDGGRTLAGTLSKRVMLGRAVETLRAQRIVAYVHQVDPTGATTAITVNVASSVATFSGAIYSIYSNVGVGSTPDTQSARYYILANVVVGIGRVTETSRLRVGDPNSTPRRGIVPISGPAQSLALASDPINEEFTLDRLTGKFGIGRAIEANVPRQLAPFQSAPAGSIPWMRSSVPATQLARKWMDVAGLTVQIGRVSDLEQARHLTAVTTSGARTFALGRASDLEIARPLTIVKTSVGQTVPIGRASDLEQARALVAVRGAISRALGRVTEAETARTLGFLGAGIAVALGRAVETGTVRSLATRLSTARAIGRVIELSSVRPLSRTSSLTVGIARTTVANQARGLGLAARFDGAVGRVSEVDSVRPMTVKIEPVIRTFGRAFEVASARALTPHTIYVRPLQRCQEVDVPGSLGRGLGPIQKQLSPVLETDSVGALELRSLYHQQLSMCVENDRAGRLALGVKLGRAEVSEQPGHLELLAVFDMPIARVQELSEVGTLGATLTFAHSLGRVLEIDTLLRPLSLTSGFGRAVEVTDLRHLSLVRTVVARRIWRDGKLEVVTLVGVWDGQRMRLAREVAWDGHTVRELAEDLVDITT